MSRRKVREVPFEILAIQRVQSDRDALVLFEVALRKRMDRLREYARELDEWSRTGGESGKHPKRVANGIRKIANEISKGER